MNISEIFNSLEGEGIRVGYLCTFIRSFGCNLRCSYCDSLYAIDTNKGHYSIMSINDIVDRCKRLGNERITFTGGEPLIQKEAKELVLTLIKEGFEVNIETNGAVDISPYTYIPNIDATKLILTMDWKSPSSEENDKMIKGNLRLLRPNDVLKFVVGSKEDLDEMKEVIDNHDLYCHIFVSPVFGKIEGDDIIQYLKDNNLQNVRVQCQLHKIFYDPNMRGV